MRDANTRRCEEELCEKLLGSSNNLNPKLTRKILDLIFIMLVLDLHSTFGSGQQPTVAAM